MARPTKACCKGMRRLSAIYVIRCETTSKCYVGSTMSFDPATAQTRDPKSFARWKSHLKQLQEGKHDSSRMQSDYDKFGEEAFKIEIVEWTDSSQIDDRESHWQKQLHPEYSRDYQAFLGKQLVENIEFTDLVKLAESEAVIVEKESLKTIMQRLAWLEQKVSVIDKRTRIRRKEAVPGQLKIDLPA